MYYSQKNVVTIQQIHPVNTGNLQITSLGLHFDLEASNRLKKSTDYRLFKTV